MRFSICSLVLLYSFTFISSAQQVTRQAPQIPPTFGSISGHVYCSDTNAPARLAKVTLMPIPEDAGPSTAVEKEKRQPQRTLFAPYRLC
jgi:hypothetical protein